MKPAQRIVSKFGSIGNLARALGHANRSTVQWWWETGFVPLKYIPAIIAAGSDLDDPVVAEDFLPAIDVEQRSSLSTSDEAA